MQELLIAFVFILVTLIFVVIFKVNTDTIKELFAILNKPKSLKAMSKSKESRMERLAKETIAMMNETGQAGKLYILIVIALFLFVFGIALGIGIGNYFLCPVFALTFSAVPYLYIRYQYVAYRKMIVDELDVTLSIISLAYERTENIIQAIKDNIDHIQPPLKEMFDSFLITAQVVNVPKAIIDLKQKIDNPVFKEWCDALLNCANDRTLKYTLRPIVDKLADIKSATGEAENILYSAKRTFWTLEIMNVVLLLLGVYGLPKGMGIKLPETFANILVAVNVAIMILTSITVIFDSRTIKYD